MLPRFRSFHGKVLIFCIVALCFIIYIKLISLDIYPSAVYKGTRQFHPRGAPREGDRFSQDGDEEPNALENSIDQWTDEEKQSTMSPYELSIRFDLQKQEPGLGDGGEASVLLDDEKERGEAIYRKIALNEELSERLPYNRSLADSRHPDCRKQQYDVANLPSASVIVIFYNEPYSVLVRTIHSTLNTCGERLLKEVILVDDGSTNVELHGKLDYYISSRLPQAKVRMVRLKNRLGLIRARLAGARLAVGDVLIFLDAHCEANVGWCEPLLERIRQSRTSVLVPIIDVIDAKDFQYSTNGFNSFQVGGFQWSGHFDWINLSEREKNRQRRECKHKRDICPAYSPTMAGGLFAIDRRYFWEVGSYDEQMDGWGGENLEMSFRVWQCGGTIETIPCSRVGHVFRDFHPYKLPNDRDTHGINTARMALVWMDDYVDVFFLNRPDLKAHPDIGDVTHRVMLRKKLRCKSFDWYLNNVYPEKFVPTKDVIDYGRIKAVDKELCLDDLLRDNEKPYNLGMFACGKPLSKSQLFSFTNNRVLRNELSCATVQHSDTLPRHVVMVPCIERDDYNEKWTYEGRRFVHDKTGMCLDHGALKNMDDVQVATCDDHSDTQLWIIDREK